MSKVAQQNSSKTFRFGGGCQLQSKGQWTIPGSLAGVNCTIVTDVVESDIPLLLSKDSMKAAKVKLNLENDSATIFGHDVDLQCTSSGHYCVPLQQHDLPVESCLPSPIKPG